MNICQGETCPDAREGIWEEITRNARYFKRKEVKRDYNVIGRVLPPYQ